MDLNHMSCRDKAVLVIEDHVDTAEMLALILKSEGYTVQMAGTARAALTILRGDGASGIGIILLDLTLPDMNGDDMILELQRNRVHLPPILIMSAKPPGSLDDAARSTGAAGVVRKPFDIQILLESIEAQLDRHSRP
jgi:DNA-binding response OmpR family regulator